MRKPSKPPLITRLPRGLREQPAWVFIGLLLMTSGLSYLLGLSESMIARAISETGLRVWGGTLALTGVLLVSATVYARPALEKLALRFMSVTLTVYLGYLLIVVPPSRQAMSIALIVSLAGLAELRVLHLKALIRHADEVKFRLGGYLND